MIRIAPRLLALVLACVLALALGPVGAPLPASAAPELGSSFSPDQARDAVKSGEVVPLRDVFAKLRDRYGGYQLDADLFSTGRGSEYRISWMTGAGRRMQFRVDARSGRILSASGG